MLGSLTTDRFPAGTSVGAYLASAEWPGAGTPLPSQGPRSVAADTSVVTAAGALTFNGLEADTAYWAVAQVGGDWRWVRFRTEPSLVARYQVSDPEDVASRWDVPSTQTADVAQFWKGGVKGMWVDGDLVLHLAGISAPAPLALVGNLAVNVRDYPYLATGLNVADDSAAIQAAINACKARGGGIVFIPRGTYKCLSGLVLTQANGTPVWLVGEGRASKLSFPVDLGAGVPAVDLGGGDSTAPNGASGLHLVGLARPATMGDTVANMWGFLARHGDEIYNCSAEGFHAGAVFNGDHNIMRGGKYTNNDYGLYWGPNHLTASNQVVDSVQLDGNLWAGVGVAKDNIIDTVEWRSCHFGAGPYAFWKETTTAGAGALNPNLSTGQLLIECSFEAIGNALFGAEAANISNTTHFDNCVGSQGPEPTAKIAALPADYAIDLPGGNLVLRFKGRNPLAPFAAGVIRGNCTTLEIDDLASPFNTAIAAGKVFVYGSVTPSGFRGFYNQNRVRVGGIGTDVSRYDVLEGAAFDGVSRAGYESVARPIRGVALHDAVHGAAGGGFVFFQVEGRTKANVSGTPGYRKWLVASAAGASAGQCLEYVPGTHDASRIFGQSNDADAPSGGTIQVVLSNCN